MTSAALPWGDDSYPGVVLRYSPRAGLLPELSRQTYDAFYKAVREAILNGLDANATRVVVDLSRVATERSLTIEDDGHGMTLDDFQRSFLGLGGSRKFASDTQFGRIGIGSLALLQYAQEAVVESSVAGSPHTMVAALRPASHFDAGGRAAALEDFEAGVAQKVAKQEPRSAHFTRVILRGLSADALRECGEVSAFYRLVEKLRRVLPLPWAEGSLRDALERIAPDVMEAIDGAISPFAGRVVIRSAWGGDIDLTHRAYGDGDNPRERWAGAPQGFLHRGWVRDEDGRRRRVTLAGYLLSQAKADVNWSGISARVQHVAVEERTFFDIESDPGFRKYIAGSVWVFGDVDTARLINIDRASFNRESRDYAFVQRYMTQVISSFKTDHVQQPQRKKVTARKTLDWHTRALASVQSVAEHAGALLEQHGVTRLPASNNGRMHIVRERTIESDLARLGVSTHRVDADRATIFVDEHGEVAAHVPENLVAPRVSVGDRSYAFRLAEARATDPPVLISARPRAITVNLAHPSIACERVDVGVALEIAYLVAGAISSEALYDAMLTLAKSD